MYGKYVRSGERRLAGAYIFTNRVNNFCYVGSSISLANRLFTGYLGPNLGQRKIDLAIKDGGLDTFFIDIYLLPQIKQLVKSEQIGKIKDLTLALEQILILEKNPEYNVLKVV